MVCFMFSAFIWVYFCPSGPMGQKGQKGDQGLQGPKGNKGEKETNSCNYTFNGFIIAILQ